MDHHTIIALTGDNKEIWVTPDSDWFSLLPDEQAAIVDAISIIERRIPQDPTVAAAGAYLRIKGDTSQFPDMYAVYAIRGKIPPLVFAIAATGECNRLLLADEIDWTTSVRCNTGLSTVQTFVRNMALIASSSRTR